MKIGKEILSEAKKKKIKICDEFLERIKISEGYKSLCAMYFKADDWVLEHDIPSIDFLKIHREGILKHNIFVDCTEEFLNLHKAAFLNGSNCSIYYDSFNIGSLIVRHDAKLKIKARDNSIIHLTCLDNASLEIESIGSSSVTVYAYGPGVQITSEGNIKVIRKNEFSSL